MSQATDLIASLTKALEAGSYNVAPSQLVQGAALQVEDLSSVMQVTTFEDDAIKLQKSFKVESCKSLLAQFDRQLSYGIFGGSAQLEGAVGQEETSDFVRITVPMCFYSHLRKVTLASTMVTTVDGKKSDERAASDAAKKIAGDIEFHLFRGKADFTHGGVFDGEFLSIPDLPDILGVDPQIRQSDLMRNAQDLMFSEYGNDESVVISGGSTLSQDNVEDAWIRSVNNHGQAKRLLVDPKVASNYNRITFAKERIVLAGSPQQNTGSDLNKQYVSGGEVKLEISIFLRGKTSPAPARNTGPASPASVSGATVTVSGVTTGFLLNQVYQYYATSGNEMGESPKSNTISVTIDTSGKGVDVTIPHAGLSNVRFFNVYRTAAGGSKFAFIGRVKVASGSSTVFRDLGNKQPGFVTGFLVQDDTWAMKELAPYSRLKMAVDQLAQTEAHFRFVTLAGLQPRKNVIIDNLR